MKKVTEKDLSKEERSVYRVAMEAVSRAYCPQSMFSVGAAVMDSRGLIYGGCNIENMSYGATICAERVAISRMVYENSRIIKFLCCVVEGGGTETGTCCGICRQVIAEFCGGNQEMPILLAGFDGKMLMTTIGVLHPYPFKF